MGECITIRLPGGWWEELRHRPAPGPGRAHVISSSQQQQNVDRAVAVLQGEGLSLTGAVCHVGKAEEDRGPGAAGGHGGGPRGVGVEMRTSRPSPGEEGWKLKCSSP